MSPPGTAAVPERGATPLEGGLDASLKVTPEATLPAREPSLLAAGAAALRRFWLPFILIQSAAVVLVLTYEVSPKVRAACEVVGVWKASGGLLSAALSGVVAGGILPEVARIVTDRSLRGLHGRGGAVAFNVAFFAFNGVVVDVFYRFEAELFGGEANLRTVVMKTLFDQFVFTPVWLVLIRWVYLWRQRGFSFAATLPALRSGFYRTRVLPLLIPNWCFWFPMVAIIYALPSSLQFALWVPVLAAWSLIMVFIADTDTDAGDG